MGLGRFHHPGPQTLPADGQHRASVQLWNLFARLADPDQHREAITSRPLLLQAIGRQTQHAGQTTITVPSAHGQHQRARAPSCPSPASSPSYGKLRSS